MPETGRLTPTELCRESFIRERLAAHGFHFSKRFGQNFLTTANVVERIAAQVEEGRSVLEIGPGFGALTAALCATGAPVTAVELDGRLLSLLEENVGLYPRLKLVRGDALRLDLHTLVPKGAPSMVCANLPYQITTPILTKLLAEECFDPLVVMVQREVARRITAEADSADYGAFTVFCALYAGAEILFSVPPECFTPRPQVHSAVVRFHRAGKTPLEERERTVALRLSRAAFAQRRKTLANALGAGLSLGREQAAERLRRAGIDPTVRGETLSPRDYGRLAAFFTDII